MKFKTMVGATLPQDLGITMMVKAAEALKYGDVVILLGTTQELTTPYMVVAKSAADSTTVVGVVCEPGGIASGGFGEIQVAGIAEVNVESAAYTVGNRINTNGGGAGTGAAGTAAAGKNIGIALEAGTVTQLTCYLLIN